MKKLAVLFLILYVLCLHAQAQKSTVAASVDKTAILIGEPLQLTLEATFSNTHAPAFFKLDSLPHFEILNRSKIDTQTANNQTTLTQRLTVTSWDSGRWRIPALSVAGVNRMTTKPVEVAVSFSPMAPDQAYHDIKDIIDVPKPTRTTWYWYVIGAAMLLLLLWLVFPKSKREVVAETKVTKEGAYKQALNNLEALQQKSSLDDKAYFTELIEIFRIYLQQGKGIHSFQQTTGDLSRQLERLNLPHGDFKKLVQTLQVSDVVKFARFTVSEEERNGAWSEIRKSIMAIEQTRT